MSSILRDIHFVPTTGSFDLYVEDQREWGKFDTLKLFNVANNPFYLEFSSSRTVCGLRNSLQNAYNDIKLGCRLTLLNLNVDKSKGSSKFNVIVPRLDVFGPHVNFDYDVSIVDDVKSRASGEPIDRIASPIRDLCRTCELTTKLVNDPNSTASSDLFSIVPKNDIRKWIYILLYLQSVEYCANSMSTDASRLCNVELRIFNAFFLEDFMNRGSSDVFSSKASRFGKPTSIKIDEMPKFISYNMMRFGLEINKPLKLGKFKMNMVIGDPIFDGCDDRLVNYTGVSIILNRKMSFGGFFRPPKFVAFSLASNGFDYKKYIISMEKSKSEFNMRLSLIVQGEHIYNGKLLNPALVSRYSEDCKFSNKHLLFCFDVFLDNVSRLMFCHMKHARKLIQTRRSLVSNLADRREFGAVSPGAVRAYTGVNLCAGVPLDTGCFGIRKDCESRIYSLLKGMHVSVDDNKEWMCDEFYKALCLLLLEPAENMDKMDKLKNVADRAMIGDVDGVISTTTTATLPQSNSAVATELGSYVASQVNVNKCKWSGDASDVQLVRSSKLIWILFYNLILDQYIHNHKMAVFSRGFYLDNFISKIKLNELMSGYQNMSIANLVDVELNIDEEFDGVYNLSPVKNVMALTIPRMCLKYYTISEDCNAVDHGYDCLDTGRTNKIVMYWNSVTSVKYSRTVKNRKDVASSKTIKTGFFFAKRLTVLLQMQHAAVHYCELMEKLNCLHAICVGKLSLKLQESLLTHCEMFGFSVNRHQSIFGKFKLWSDLMVKWGATKQMMVVRDDHCGDNDDDESKSDTSHGVDVLFENLKVVEKNRACFRMSFEDNVNYGMDKINPSQTVSLGLYKMAVESKRSLSLFPFLNFDRFKFTSESGDWRLGLSELLQSNNCTFSGKFMDKYGDAVGKVLKNMEIDGRYRTVGQKYIKLLILNCLVKTLRLSTAKVGSHWHDNACAGFDFNIGILLSSPIRGVEQLKSNLKRDIVKLKKTPRLYTMLFEYLTFAEPMKLKGGYFFDSVDSTDATADRDGGRSQTIGKNMIELDYSGCYPAIMMNYPVLSGSCLGDVKRSDGEKNTFVMKVDLNDLDEIDKELKSEEFPNVVRSDEVDPSTATTATTYQLELWNKSNEYEISCVQNEKCERIPRNPSLCYDYLCHYSHVREDCKLNQKMCENEGNDDMLNFYRKLEASTKEKLVSLYGCMGKPGELYDPRTFNAVTLIGRIFLAILKQATTRMVAFEFEEHSTIMYAIDVEFLNACLVYFYNRVFGVSIDKIPNAFGFDRTSVGTLRYYEICGDVKITVKQCLHHTIDGVVCCFDCLQEDLNFNVDENTVKGCRFTVLCGMTDSVFCEMKNFDDRHGICAPDLKSVIFQRIHDFFNKVFGDFPLPKLKTAALSSRYFKNKNKILRTNIYDNVNDDGKMSNRQLVENSRFIGYRKLIDDCAYFKYCVINLFETSLYFGDPGQSVAVFENFVRVKQKMVDAKRDFNLMDFYMRYGDLISFCKKYKNNIKDNLDQRLYYLKNADEIESGQAICLKRIQCDEVGDLNNLMVVPMMCRDALDREMLIFLGRGNNNMSVVTEEKLRFVFDCIHEEFHITLSLLFCIKSLRNVDLKIDPISEFFKVKMNHADSEQIFKMPYSKLEAEQFDETLRFGLKCERDKNSDVVDCSIDQNQNQTEVVGITKKRKREFTESKEDGSLDSDNSWTNGKRFKSLSDSGYLTSLTDSLDISTISDTSDEDASITNNRMFNLFDTEINFGQSDEFIQACKLFEYPDFDAFACRAEISLFGQEMELSPFVYPGYDVCIATCT